MMGNIQSKETMKIFDRMGTEILEVTGTHDAVMGAFKSARNAAYYVIVNKTAYYTSSDGRVQLVSEMDNQHLVNAILKLWRDEVGPMTVQSYLGGRFDPSAALVRRLLAAPGTDPADPAYNAEYATLLAEFERREEDLPF